MILFIYTYIHLFLAIFTTVILVRWHLSTSLPYVNVTGPCTDVFRIRFSSGFAFPHFRTHWNVHQKNSPLCVPWGGWMSEEPIEKLKSFSPFQERLLLSFWERAMHELLLNSTTVSAFVKLDPVSTRTPLFPRLVPFPRREIFTPSSCREILHRAEGWPRRIVVCICILSEIVRVKKVSQHLRRCTAGVSIS